MDLNKTRSSYKSDIITKKLYVNGLNISSGTYLGMRNENQDNITIENYNDNSIFILCDGHGGSYLSKRIPNILMDKFFKNEDFSDHKTINNMFIEIDKYIYKEYYSYNHKREGTTCCIVILNKDSIIGINLGDSGYFICSNSDKKKSENHRPNNQTEISRILESGHKIIKVGKEFRIDGKLSLSRSFGDFDYKLNKKKLDSSNNAVSVIPDLKIYDKDFNYILLASDGFWDYIDIEKVSSFISLQIRNKTTEYIVGQLIKLAINNGSRDNISIILIKVAENKS